MTGLHVSGAFGYTGVLLVGPGSHTPGADIVLDIDDVRRETDQ